MAIALAGLLMLVGCSANSLPPSIKAPASSGPATPGGQGAAMASPSTPEPGVGASPKPVPTIGDATPLTGETTSHATLEDLLPDEIGGHAAHKGTMPGNAFLTSGLATPDLGDYLVRLGVQPQAITVSFAYTVAGPSGTGVFAFKVKGASSADLLRAVTDGRQPEVRGSVGWQSKVVGGKPTATAVDASWAGGNLAYRYAAGDVVFFMTAGRESTAAEVLASLP